MLITGKALADAAGVSKAAITQAVGRGDLLRTGDKLFDTENPLVRYYVAGQSYRLEIPEADLLARLDAAPAAPERRAAPKDEPLAPWSRQTVDLDAEDSYLEIRADFGDGGHHPIIRHRFNSRDQELDSFIYPIPRAVRLDYGGKDIRVFDLKTGKELPESDESRGNGFEDAKEVHA